MEEAVTPSYRMLFSRPVLSALSFIFQHFFFLSPLPIVGRSSSINQINGRQDSGAKTTWGSPAASQEKEMSSVWWILPCEGSAGS